MTRKKKKPEEISFWQSASDLLTALILVLLLVILLLTLYLIQVDEDDYTSYHDNEYEDVDGGGGHGHKWDDEYKDDDDDHDDNGGGNGGGNGDGTDDGEYPEESEGIKSAVYVTLIDADTKKAIKEQGVEFELYSAKNAVQILNTYYPKKTAYKKYETTKDGTFYLPEKVFESSYYLHQLTDVEGYDPADKVEFTINDIYDWPDPYVVKVPLYPARDIIRIQMLDKETGESVSGGEFTITALEDIVTQDGTTRLRKGEAAGTIKCDENGYGESEKLFLGKYQVKQSSIPEYYAGTDEIITKDLSQNRDDKEKDDSKEEKDKAEESVISQVLNERTEITMTLTDELTGDALKDAEFAVNGINYKTDDSGAVILDNVDKDASYEFVQASSQDGYSLSNPVTVKVSKDGKISGKANASISVTNRILRTDISPKDAVIGNHLADIKVSLYKGNKLISTWTSNGAYEEIMALEPGKYTVTLDDNNEKKYNITVTDTAEIQYNDIRIFTAKSYLAIGLCSIALAAFVYLSIRIISKRKRNNHDK